MKRNTPFNDATSVSPTLASGLRCGDGADGVNDADVMLIDGKTVRTLIPTAGLLNDVDAAQLHLGRDEGPCLRAAFTDLLVRCPDLRTDTRCPRFAAVAVAAGIGAMTSFQHYTHPDASSTRQI